VIDKVIPIPRILIQQSNEVATGFNDSTSTFQISLSACFRRDCKDNPETNEYEILRASGGVIRDIRSHSGE